MSVVYYENAFVQKEEARIPITDRGFQFGDGAYTTIQVRDGIPFFLEEHLDQLKTQCLSFHVTFAELSTETVEELIRLNGAYSGIWRLKIFVTGGDSTTVGLPMREGRVIMYMHPFTLQPFKPLHLEIFSVPYYSCHAAYKSLAHLNRLYVAEEATRRGVDDCVTVTENGVLLEASFGNLVFIVEKKILTPDPALPLYFGITAKNVLKLAEELGFEVEYIRLPITELPHEAAAFRTNSMQGVRPIVQMGETTFRRKPVIESLFMNSYEDLLQQEAKKKGGKELAAP